VLAGSLVCAIRNHEGSKQLDGEVKEIVRQVLDNYDIEWVYDGVEDLQRLYDSAVELIAERGFDVKNGKVVKR